jgi:hypothetical protein
MRVFILSTGRCGSVTIERAFSHARNYTTGHESKINSFYDPLEYPDWHIESDNRLAWFLGELERAYPEARYIHLLRNQDEYVASIKATGIDYGGSILRAFGGILQNPGGVRANTRRAAARLWALTNTNIEVFLKDKPHETVWLHELSDRFPALWQFVGAEGDLDAALAETRVRHNEHR